MYVYICTLVYAYIYILSIINALYFGAPLRFYYNLFITPTYRVSYSKRLNNLNSRTTRAILRKRVFIKTDYKFSRRYARYRRRFPAVSPTKRSLRRIGRAFHPAPPSVSYDDIRACVQSDDGFTGAGQIIIIIDSFFGTCT